MYKGNIVIGCDYRGLKASSIIKDYLIKKGYKDFFAETGVSERICQKISDHQLTYQEISNAVLGCDPKTKFCGSNVPSGIEMLRSFAKMADVNLDSRLLGENLFFDFGCYNPSSDDEMDAIDVAKVVTCFANQYKGGIPSILSCKTGEVMVNTAAKLSDHYATLALRLDSAQMGRVHNDSHTLVFPGDGTFYRGKGMVKFIERSIDDFLTHERQRTKTRDRRLKKRAMLN